MMKAPIPGQSLTNEPGAAQYERPPRYTSTEDAFDAYTEKFDDPEVREALFTMLESGAPVSSVVTILTREAVRNGIHSFDNAVILRPLVHEYITVLADAAGVDYEEDVVEQYKKKNIANEERKMIAMRVYKQLQDASPQEEDTSEETELFEEPMSTEEPSVPEEPGLMQRRFNSPQEGMM